MATIKDIANILGVSISTVSKGLNDASDISDAMRQKVLDTAMEIGYIHKKKPPSIKKKICIIIEKMDYNNINDFGYEIVAGFHLAAESSYEVSVVPCDSINTQYLTYDEYMRENNYCGSFFMGFDLNNEYIKQLQTTDIPTVLLDNVIYDNPKVGYVGTDSSSSMHLVVKHLYDLGHKNIAFLNGFDNSFICVKRRDGFTHSMQKFGLTVKPSLMGQGYNTPDTAKEFTTAFLERGATAIVCTSDVVASGVINELYRIGKKVPKDVSVIGYDDIPLAKYLTPPLTTIRQNRMALGRSAYSMLDQLINGVSVALTLMHPELIVRESTSNAPKN